MRQNLAQSLTFLHREVVYGDRAYRRPLIHQYTFPQSEDSSWNRETGSEEYNQYIVPFSFHQNTKPQGDTV